MALYCNCLLLMLATTADAALSTHVNRECAVTHAEAAIAPRALLQASILQTATGTMNDRVRDWTQPGNSSESSKSPDLTSADEDRYLVVTLATLLLVMLICHVKWSIDSHTENSSPTAPPWFCDRCMVLRFGVVGVLGWFLIGIVVFTQELTFGKDRRHLTIFEAIYLCTQIMTTVGYGDFEPSTKVAFGFIACYLVLGVTFFGLLFAEVLNFANGSQKQLGNVNTMGARTSAVKQRHVRHTQGRYDQLFQALIPCVLLAILGTLFFHYYPGEDKPFWQAFYTSVVSLTSVGFASFHPVTQVGYLFTSVWLLLGVTSTANMIVTLGNCLFHYRKEVRAEHMGMEVLRRMDRDQRGKVDKLEFLRFELVRRGHCDADEIDDVLELFAELDSQKRGEIDVHHLESFVSSESLQRIKSFSPMSST
eukprot:TRINITY_DN31058_c0_g1_i1.p1 TRINITY_DN31058_c0_g1~~TRINITY_DN31058_c0_g1_i1.p1  ORF type:complete len:422 (+),score=51.08 TRINITY_DN31058_c0_g1_i1:105-1370(+)